MHIVIYTFYFYFLIFIRFNRKLAIIYPEVRTLILLNSHYFHDLDILTLSQIQELEKSLYNSMVLKYLIFRISEK